MDYQEKPREACGMFGIYDHPEGAKLTYFGLYALQHNVDRLFQDHFNAKRLAGGLANVGGIVIQTKSIETNIVMATVRSGWGTAQKLETASREKGVLFHSFGRQKVRFVTHFDISTSDIDRVIKVIKASLTEQRERYY